MFLLIFLDHSNFQCHGVVFNREVQFPNAVVTTSSIEIGISVISFDGNHSREILNGLRKSTRNRKQQHYLLVLSKSFEADPSVVQPMNILIVMHETLCVIRDCFLAVTEFGIAVRAVVHTLGRFTSQFHFLGVAVYGILKALDLAENETHVGIDD